MAASSAGRLLLVLIVLHFCYPGYALQERGKFYLRVNQENNIAVITKNVHNNTYITGAFGCYSISGCDEFYPENAKVVISYEWYHVWFPCAGYFKGLVNDEDLETAFRNGPQYSLEVYTKGLYSYLFYTTMLILYILAGIVWFIFLSVKWKNVLWFHGCFELIIIMGIVEHLVFLADVKILNDRGNSLLGVHLSAELVSSFKNACAIVVGLMISSGYDAYRPPSLIKRVVTRCLVLAVLDFSTRVLFYKVALGVLYTMLCGSLCLAFMALSQTLRKLRHGKYIMFRCYKNGLAFAFIGVLVCTAIYIVYRMWFEFEIVCLDTRLLWLQGTFFFAVLMVVMVLWRPTFQNHSSSYSQLLDDYKYNHDKLFNSAGIITDENVETNGRKEMMKKILGNCLSCGLKWALESAVTNTINILKLQQKVYIESWKEEKTKKQFDEFFSQDDNVKLEHEYLHFKITEVLQKQLAHKPRDGARNVLDSYAIWMLALLAVSFGPPQK